MFRGLTRGSSRGWVPSGLCGVPGAAAVASLLVTRGTARGPEVTPFPTARF